MSRYLFLALALGMAGCGSSGSMNPFASSSSSDDVKNAAFAARIQYPTTSKSANDLQAMSVVNRSGGTIKVYNLGEMALNDVKVWVNGAYVSRVDTIPAHGSATLNRSDFFDSNGDRLSKQETNIAKVELETSDSQLYLLLGPAFE